MPDAIGEAALQAYLPTFCRSCDLVIAPSPGMREVLRRFKVDVPIDVIPNGVDIRQLRQPVQPLDRSEFGFNTEDVILIYVGRLGPEKNLPFLLRSFAGTAQAYDNVKLMVIGGGQELDNLQDRARHMHIQDRTKFTGMVPYDQVARYLAMADAFVTASVTEVHPLSVIEAMAAGLPVLGIESPGISDTIKDGETGFLIREQDLAGYTAKMVRLVVDHDGRKRMGTQARKAVEQYDIERTTQLMLEQYQRVIREASGRTRGFRARFTRLADRWRQ